MPQRVELWGYTNKCLFCIGYGEASANSVEENDDGFLDSPNDFDETLDPLDTNLESFSAQTVSAESFQSTSYCDGLASEPLYYGASTTVLQALVHYFKWLSEHPGVSRDALSEMLHMQHKILPTGNLLPDSYRAAMRVAEPHLIKPEVIHVCPKDCILFRGQFAQLSECPICHSKRYIDQTCIPVRKFIYLPIGPRLIRLFGTASLAGLMYSSADSGEQKDEVHDVQESPAWQRAYGPGGSFAGNKRGISLALCTDGVNRYAHNRVSYSMWPIMLTVLNSGTILVMLCW